MRPTAHMLAKLLALLGLLAAVAVSPGPTPGFTQDVWDTAPPLPQPLQEHAVVPAGGRIHVLGGFDAAGRGTRAHYVYDPGSGAWSSAAPLPLPLHHSPAATLGGRIYLLGGLVGRDFQATNRVFVYDPAEDHWKEASPLPHPLGGGRAAVWEGQIYVAGGYREGGWVADFFRYNPRTDRWTELPPLPTPRDHLAVEAHEGRIFVIGGRNSRSFALGATEAYDIATGAWTTLPPLPTPRSGVASAVVEGKVYIFGGEGNRTAPDGTFQAVERFDPVRNRWEVASPLPQGRHGFMAAVAGRTLYLPGGGYREGFGATAVHWSIPIDRLVQRRAHNEHRPLERRGADPVLAILRRPGTVRQEPLYVNMPCFGLARATACVPATGRRTTARGRLGADAKGGPQGRTGSFSPSRPRAERRCWPGSKSPPTLAPCGTSSC